MHLYIFYYNVAQKFKHYEQVSSIEVSSTCERGTKGIEDMARSRKAGEKKNYILQLEKMGAVQSHECLSMKAAFEQNIKFRARMTCKKQKGQHFVNAPTSPIPAFSAAPS